MQHFFDRCSPHIQTESEEKYEAGKDTHATFSVEATATLGSLDCDTSLDVAGETGYWTESASKSSHNSTITAVFSTFTSSFPSLSKFHLSPSCDVVLSILLLTVSLCGQLLLRKLLTTNAMGYRFVLMQCLVAVSCICSAVVCCVKQWKTNKLLSEGICLKDYILMAFFEFLFMTFSFIPSGVVPGALTVVVPFAFVVTIIVTSSIVHCCLPALFGVVGSVSVISGIVFCVILGFPNDPRQYSSSIILILISTVPQCLSILHKYSVLTSHKGDVFFMNFMVTLIQFFGGFLLCPIALEIQKLDTKHHSVTIPELPENLAHSMLCLVGINSSPYDTCQHTYGIYVFVGLILCSILSVVLPLRIMKATRSDKGICVANGGASFAAFLLFYVPGIAGLAKTEVSLNFAAVAGLILTICGYLVYALLNDEVLDVDDEAKIWNLMTKLKPSRRRKRRENALDSQNRQYVFNPNKMSPMDIPGKARNMSTDTTPHTWK